MTDNTGDYPLIWNPNSTNPLDDWDCSSPYNSPFTPVLEPVTIPPTFIENFIKVNQVDYKFKEDLTFKEAMDYINSTYSAHYSEKGGVQALDFIMANSESLDFLKGNAIKYIARFGKKEGYNKKDLFKAIHYIVLLYYFSQDLTPKE